MHDGTTLTDAMRRHANDGAISPGGRLSFRATEAFLDKGLKKWATPAARDYKGSNSDEHLAKERGHHDQLANQVVLMQQWRTPTARDGSGTGARPIEERLAQGHSVGLKDMVSTSGPQAPATSTAGAGSRPVLNPAFVELLQGLPIGWTLPMRTAMTVSDFLETVSFPSVQRLLGASSGDDSMEDSE
jgi:hypothetical protein